MSTIWTPEQQALAPLPGNWSCTGADPRKAEAAYRLGYLHVLLQPREPSPYSNPELTRQWHWGAKDHLIEVYKHPEVPVLHPITEAYKWHALHHTTLPETSTP